MRSVLNNRAFLLFEVMVSIVIITVSLVIIIHSFSYSKDAILRSKELFKASLLLENKIWGFEEAGVVEEGAKSGDYAGDEAYGWRLSAGRTGDSEINLVVMEAFRKSDPANTSYSLHTYLKNKI